MKTGEEIRVDPSMLLVPICEPAQADVQAINACEFVLDQLSKQSQMNEYAFREVVVAWLAKKYIGKEI